MYTYVTLFKLLFTRMRFVSRRSVIPLVHGRIYRSKINLDAADLLPRQKIQGPSNGCPLLAGTFGFTLADFLQIEAAEREAPRVNLDAATT